MFRVHFLSATPIQTALSTHIGVPESNRVSGLRCAALRDPFAWVLSIHPAASMLPLLLPGKGLGVGRLALGEASMAIRPV